MKHIAKERSDVKTNCKDVSINTQNAANIARNQSVTVTNIHDKCTVLTSILPYHHHTIKMELACNVFQNMYGPKIILIVGVENYMMA